MGAVHKRRRARNRFLNPCVKLLLYSACMKQHIRKFNKHDVIYEHPLSLKHSRPQKAIKEQGKFPQQAVPFERNFE